MKRAWVIMGVLLLAVQSRAGTAWEEMQQGLKNYADGKFAAAATNFDAAGMAANKEKFDPAVPAFDRANAMLRAGNAQDAAHIFEEALRTSDLGLQSKAYHNRGNTLLSIAGGQEKEQKFDDAIKSVDEAMAMYERAMMLQTKDRDPKINYELAGLKRQELEEKLKQQQQEQKQDQKKDDQNNKDDQKDQSDQNKDQQQKQDQQSQDQQNKDQNKDPKDPGEQNPDQQEQSAEDQKQEQRDRTERMTPQEAAMLLDAMKQREQSQRDKLVQMWLNRAKSGKQQPVDKDW